MAARAAKPEDRAEHQLRFAGPKRPRKVDSATATFSNSPRCRLSFSECAFDSGSSTPVTRSSAPGNARAKSERNGMLPPWPMSIVSRPHAAPSASVRATYAGPLVDAVNASPVGPRVIFNSAPHGALASRCFTSASCAAFASWPGGTRIEMRAFATGHRVFDASLTGVASNPIEAQDGLAQGGGGRRPAPVGLPGRRGPAPPAEPVLGETGRVRFIDLAPLPRAAARIAVRRREQPPHRHERVGDRTAVAA